MPAVTAIAGLICSLFQFSGIVIGTSSVSYKNPYFEFQPKKEMILWVVGLLVLIQVVYMLLVSLCLWRIYKSQNIRRNASLFYLVSWFRIVVSKLLFLPIFHILSYSVSCHCYENLGERRCSFNPSLPCILTPRKNMNGLEINLVFAAFLALVWHTGVGLLSEILDFSFKASNPTGHPK